MTERRGGCLAFIALQAAGLLWSVIVVLEWTAMLLTYRRYGLSPAVCVALAGGAVGWWLIFHRLEPLIERLVERMYRPRDAQMEGIAGQLAWGAFHPALRVWRRIIWLFVVFAPIAQMLLRAR